MRIHIMGASCAGSTTLGKALEQKLGFPYFDTDTYFWEYSELAFTVRREPLLRNQMLYKDLAEKSDYIVGGSLIDWGGEWRNYFDLVVFLYVPREIRLQRLKDREFKLHGKRLFSDPEHLEKYQAFLNWASGYDDGTTKGRNLSAHKLWLSQLNCKVLEISGDTSVADRIKLILPLISAT